MASRTLFDLSIDVGKASQGERLVEYALHERSPYPPRPVMRQGEASLVSAVGAHDAAYASIDAADMDTLAQRAAAADKRGDYVALARSLTALALSDSAQNMLSQLCDQFVQERDSSLDELPQVQSRIGIHVSAQQYWDLPWEHLFLGHKLLRDAMPQIAIVRRFDGPARMHSAPLDLPINVIVKDLTTPSFGAGWADDLFDGFTHYARDLGGLRWSLRSSLRGAAEVHHLVFDEDSQVVALREIFERYQKPQSYTPPRLLVLHDLRDTISPAQSRMLCRSALGSGVDAVLYAQMPTPDPTYGGFFPFFYRKIMHNWPLDQAHGTALAVAGESNELPNDWCLALRREGELGLLLTQALVEGAQGPDLAAQAGVQSEQEKDGKDEQELDIEQELADEDGAQMWEEMSDGAVGRHPRHPPISRQGRRKRRLMAHLAKDAGTIRCRMERIVGASADIGFDQEFHGIAAMINMRDHLRRARDEHHRDAAAMIAIRDADEEAMREQSVRLTTVWLTDPTQRDARLIKEQPLLQGRSYDLHVQITPRRIAALAAVALNEETLERIFDKQETIELTLALFAPETDFHFLPKIATLVLPRIGESDAVQVSMTPQISGQRRLRLCLYYRNVLLQSLVLEAQVIESVSDVIAGDGLQVTVDYVANADLDLLDDYPQPALSVFTNQAVDGSHWVGAFAGSSDGGQALRSSNMHTFGSLDMATLAEMVREPLLDVEGQNAYRFRARPPLTDHESAGRQEDLARLAVQGRLLYDQLFESHQDALPISERDQLIEALRAPGIISVARCRGASTTLPWSALYDKSLDTGRVSEVKLCPIFAAQITNLWVSAEPEPAWLADPTLICQAAECPLRDRATVRITVCPFGFWGLRHQIELPLQYVTPTPIDDVPPELAYAGFGQTMRLNYGLDTVDPMIRMLFGYDSTIPNSVDHLRDMETASGISAMAVKSCDDRRQVLDLVERGGYQVYYFYCHGEGAGDVFRLRFGPGEPRHLAAADLDREYVQWGHEVQPLVFINGCESVDLTPERIHGFLGKLRSLGASGVIGSEVKVWTDLARPFGQLVMGHLLSGNSLGEAFLLARRRLLCDLNPLGLIYTLHAPAGLHLHRVGNCSWCREHGLDDQ